MERGRVSGRVSARVSPSAHTDRPKKLPFLHLPALPAPLDPANAPGFGGVGLAPWPLLLLLLLRIVGVAVFAIAGGAQEVVVIVLLVPLVATVRPCSELVSDIPRCALRLVEVGLGGDVGELGRVEVKVEEVELRLLCPAQALPRLVGDATLRSVVCEQRRSVGAVGAVVGRISANVRRANRREKGTRTYSWPL